MFGLYYSNKKEIPTVYIVISDNYDVRVDLASTTIHKEFESVRVKVIEILLSQWDKIRGKPDALVIIGHGRTDGIETPSGVLPWTELYTDISVIDPTRTVVLACKSPTDLRYNIYGFVGQIDAEAGALLSVWHIRQIINYDIMDTTCRQRIFECQLNMANPLGTYLYFVHGYYGNNGEFDHMINIIQPDLLLKYDGFRYFDYFEDYPSLTPIEIHNVEFGISAYANNFANKILSSHNSGDQIDIVAHSMGGIITRELLNLNRTELDLAGIGIGKIITLGTPHLGTVAAVNPVGDLVAFIMSLMGQNWDTPVFRSLAPDSALMYFLNYNPMIYSEGIEWYTIAGINYAVNAQFMGIFEGDNDGIVAVSSAHLSFSDQLTIEDIAHENLINDTLYCTYGYIDEWLVGPLDSDGDDISNALEISVYHTNPYNTDSDGDGMPDDWEIRFLPDLNPLTDDAHADCDSDDLDNINEYLLGTDVLDFDSDDDYLYDGEEVDDYLTDPLNSDSDYDTLLDGDEIDIYGSDPLSIDSDDDGMPDQWEAQYYDLLYLNYDDSQDDLDSDGLDNLDEYLYGSDAFNIDSDGDSLFDGNEVNQYFTDPMDSDSDDDELSDGYEINTSHTYPYDWDSDDDTLSDGFELDAGSDPMSSDGDSDQMPDVWEVQYMPYLDPMYPDAYYDCDDDELTNLNEYLLSTNPIDCDSDSDQMPDGWEVQYGLNPLVDDSQSDLDSDDLTNVQEYICETFPDDSDSDNDAIPDEWEVQNGLNPLFSDAQQDTDADGLSNLEEYQYSTNPQDSDSDNDALSDWVEIYTYSTDPLDNDSDNDALTDGSEINSHGTNPLAWSTDADFLSDGQEIAWGYDPNDSDDPITATELIASAWSKSILGYVRVNDPLAVDYVKVYVKYKDSSGWWTNYYYLGRVDDVHPVYQDYYMCWTLQYGYVQMKVYVKAYDSGAHFIGSDVYYANIKTDGGDPPPL